MTDVKFLLLHIHSRNNLAVCIQMGKSKLNDLYWREMLEILTVKETEIRFV